MPYSNPAAQREYQREWIRRRRDEWIASKGGVCAECGSDSNLEIDHIDPSTKLCNPRDVWSRSAEFRHAELAKCQVLCEACHSAKTKLQFMVGHGTQAMYRKRGCRCSECKEWLRSYWREYRQRKKAA